MLNAGKDDERINVEEFKALITGLVAEQHDLNEGLTLDEVKDITGLEPDEVQKRLVKIRADQKAAQLPPLVSAPAPVTPTVIAPPQIAPTSDTSEGFDYSKSLDPNVQPEEFVPLDYQEERHYSDPIDPTPFLNPDQPPPKIPQKVIDPMTGQTTAGIVEPFDYTKSLDPEVEAETPNLDDAPLEGAGNNGQSVLNFFLVLAVFIVLMIIIVAVNGPRH
jgi:hypothetical protein